MREVDKVLDMTKANCQTILSTDAAIRQRKTVKVLAQEAQPTSDQRDTLTSLLSLAGMAPFHRACDEMHRAEGATHSLTGIEPWRFYVADGPACRQLMTQIPQENAGKIPSMLSAADALILATWLPNPASPTFSADSHHLFEPTEANMEHIAAASAAIQNLLLAATARGISNYWSSGGVLRSNQVFSLLHIPLAEILLGAIFLFPTEIGSSQSVTSKLREHRCSPQQWSRHVEV